jgi:hypothetical protein
MSARTGDELAIVVGEGRIDVMGEDRAEDSYCDYESQQQALGATDGLDLMHVYIIFSITHLAQSFSKSC